MLNDIQLIQLLGSFFLLLIGLVLFFIVDRINTLENNIEKIELSIKRNN